MNDSDITMPVPKPTPPRNGVSPSEVENLWAAGAGIFDTHRTSPTASWQPPSVEALQLLLPQYEISAFIARGGMGAVYKGMQRSLKRSVAIKIMPPRADDGDMQFAARFKQEAQAMAHLAHPNIVAVFDAGEVELPADGNDGRTLLYFVMEFIEGTDVAQLIASEGLLEPSRAVPIIAAVCEALAFAHDEGIVHRDIKPSNIMIDRRGRIKVADFGLAKAASIGSMLITRSDVAMGTPDFIAPETLVPGLAVDGRADLYAVGVTLYQMLTGRIPRGRFELPSEVVPRMGKEFDAIVDKAMQTDRDKRYSSATEMKVDLESAVLNRRASTDDQSKPKRPDAQSALETAAGKNERAKGRFYPAKVWILSLSAAILAIGGSALVFMRGTEKRAEISSATKPYLAPPVYPAGQWVKVWLRAEDIPNAKVMADDWAMMNPPFASAHVPGAIGQNWGVRSRLRLSQGVPPPQLQLRDSEGRGYNVILVYDSIRFRRNDPAVQSHNVELGKQPLKLPGVGQEFTLEFIAIGQRLIARLDGQTFTMLLDPSSYPALSGDITLYQVDRNAFRDVEVINLEGLNEGEALKAVGVSLSSATTVAPSKVYTYPVGQWVNPFQEASDLDFSLTQRGTTLKEGWITPGATTSRTISLSALNISGKNWGVRARYRWQQNGTATLHLRRTQMADKSLMTYDFIAKGGKAGFYQSQLQVRSGSPIVKSSPLGEPSPLELREGEEVLVEAFAIGQKLHGRVNDKTFEIKIENASDPGGFGISTSVMSFHDAEFINLDGLSEAEARKVAGLEN